MSDQVDDQIDGAQIDGVGTLIDFWQKYAEKFGIGLKIVYLCIIQRTEGQ